MNAAWPRPRYRAQPESALLVYYIFGAFAAETPARPPAGASLQRHDNAELRRWDGYPLSGALGGLLVKEQPELSRNAAEAESCMVLRFEGVDPPDLEYLRGSINAIAALLDAGGMAVADPQTLSLIAPAQWRATHGAGRFSPRDHLLILRDEADAGGRVAVRTRGMRKFARPDLYITGVPVSAENAAGHLVEQLAGMLALGDILGDGTEVEAQGVPEGMRARLIEDDTDARFNNRRLELEWPR